MVEPTEPRSPQPPPAPSRSWVERSLDLFEWAGNKLPDPSVLFLLGLLLTWGLSKVLSGVAFDVIDPDTEQPLVIHDQLTGDALAHFLQNMVTYFAEFPPLGVVLVAMLGVGVAESSGFIQVCLKELLRLTHRTLLTPMLLLVAIVSHTAADAGYLLVIPIGGVIFLAAGRHPLAGIAAAFAGVSGGFSANFIPSGIDPLLASLTEAGVQVLDRDYSVNPLCNIYFTAASSLVVILVGWYLTDRIVEPRLRSTPFEADGEVASLDQRSTARERRGMWAGLAVVALGALGLAAWAWPETSPLRAEGSLTSARPQAPLMGAIVPLIFLFFLIPGTIHGYVSGTFKNHRDVVGGMKKAMESMGYYLVLVFFAALFINVFTRSNLGRLIALKGAGWLEAWEASPTVTITGIIFLVAVVNLVVGSASAKWAMLSPIFVPMLMARGISPELTQAAYRVGDSCTNIVTPMMPYFPLVVVFCQRYTKGAGIGTLGSMMLPYSITFLVVWTLFLLAYWALGIPLGLQAPYEYVPAN